MAILESLALRVDSRQLATAARHLREIGTAGRESGNSLSAWQRQAAGTSNIAGGIARNLGRIASAFAIEETVRRSVNAFVDYESQLAEIGKTTGATAPEIRDLSDALSELAASGELPVAGSELRDIAAAAGRLGIQGTDNILAFTESIAQLTIATPLLADEAANSFGKLLALTGEPVTAIGAIGSAFAAVSDQVSAGEREILPAVSEIARGIAQFGVASEDIIAIGATLAGLGIQADSARTTLLKAFSSITAGAAGSAEDLERLAQVAGTTEAEFRALAATSPADALVALLQGLRELDDIGRIEAIESLFGSDVRARSTIGPLIQDLDSLVDALETTRSQSANPTRLLEELERQLDTSGAKFQTFRERAAQAFVGLGEGLATGLAPVFEQLGRGLDSGAFERFGQIAGEALTRVADVGAELADFLESDLAQSLGGNIGDAAEALASNVDLVAIALSGLLTIRVGATVTGWGVALAGVGRAMATASAASRAAATEQTRVTSSLVAQQTAALAAAREQQVLARAHVAAAASASQQARAMPALTAANLAASQAQRALAASQAAVAASSRLAVRNLGLVAGAATAARRAMTLLGGPVGAVLLAVEGFYLLSSSADDAADHLEGTSAASNRFAEGLRPLNDLIRETGIALDDMGVAARNAAEKDLALAAAEVARLQALMASRGEADPTAGIQAFFESLLGGGLGGRLDSATSRLEAFQDRLTQIKEGIKDQGIAASAEALQGQFPGIEGRPSQRAAQIRTVEVKAETGQATEALEDIQARAEAAAKTLVDAFGSTRTPTEDLAIALARVDQAMSDVTANQIGAETLGVAGAVADSELLVRAYQQLGEEAIDAGASIASVREQLLALGEEGATAVGRIDTARVIAEIDELEDRYITLTDVISEARGFEELIRQAELAGQSLDGETITARLEDIITAAVQAGATLDQVAEIMEMFGSSGTEALERQRDALDDMTTSADRYASALEQVEGASARFTSTFARGLARGEGLLESLGDAVTRFKERLIEQALEEAVFGPLLDQVFGSERAGGPTPERGHAAGGILGQVLGVAAAASQVPGAATTTPQIGTASQPVPVRVAAPPSPGALAGGLGLAAALPAAAGAAGEAGIFGGIFDDFLAGLGGLFGGEGGGGFLGGLANLFGSGGTAGGGTGFLGSLGGLFTSFLGPGALGASLGQATGGGQGGASSLLFGGLGALLGSSFGPAGTIGGGLLGGLFSRLFSFHGGGQVTAAASPDWPRFHGGGLVTPALAAAALTSATVAPMVAAAAPMVAPTLTIAMPRFHDGGKVQQAQALSGVGYPKKTPADLISDAPTTLSARPILPAWPRFHTGGAITAATEVARSAMPTIAPQGPVSGLDWPRHDPAAEVAERALAAMERLERLHSGGAVQTGQAPSLDRLMKLQPGEVPIIAQVGEIVLTAAQAQSIASLVQGKRFHEGGTVGGGAGLDDLLARSPARDQDAPQATAIEVNINLSIDARGAGAQEVRDLRKMQREIADRAADQAVARITREVGRNPVVKAKVRGGR